MVHHDTRGAWGIIFSSEKFFSPEVNEILFCTFSSFGSRSSWVMSHFTVALTSLIQGHGNKFVLFCIILPKGFVGFFFPGKMFITSFVSVIPFKKTNLPVFP